ncbi:MAG: electron transfer flavoprotein subunit alpha [Kiritimatiellae bacterium]|nr:electron transfer flavoprotein subunit alpha [Kiritimatiellia bacterium]
MADILLVLHTGSDGSFSKGALESIATTVDLSSKLGGSFAVGVIGAGAGAAADTIAGCGAEKFYVVEDEAVAAPRYSSDVKAATALIQKAGAQIVLAPGSSRFARCMPGAAYRAGAQIDTHIVALAVEAGVLKAQRWYYRQRILTTLSRAARPWVLLIEGGIQPAWQGAAGVADAESVAVEFTDAELRTTIKGIESPATDAQTIRPDAALLFVAGAGWTKKQADGAYHIRDASNLIQGFLKKAGASLGSSKSLVDLQSDGQETLSFMSHMNQVGQTGTTPRHAKGLSTCCHGEEPHAVGWRFINERRAINMDANCGWAQGKADVVYIANAFEVIAKVNELLG